MMEEEKQRTENTPNHISQNSNSGHQILSQMAEAQKSGVISAEELQCFERIFQKVQTNQNFMNRYQQQRSLIDSSEVNIRAILNSHTSINYDLFQYVQKKYISMIESHTALMEITDIYSIPIKHEIVSPNDLHGRFQRPEIHLTKTTIDTRINQEIEKKFAQGNNKIYLKGPIGIGKSHALLARVLNLRKMPNNMVIYVNDPFKWKNNKYDYIIHEIIYSFIPFRKSFATRPPYCEKLLLDEDPLLQWYYALNYLKGSDDNLHNTPLESYFGVFQKYIQDFANSESIRIHWISDQEDLLSRILMKDQNSKGFPFNLRFEFGDTTILSSQTNNFTEEIPSDFSVIDTFERLPENEIRSLVDYSFQLKNFGEANYFLLNQACGGNPLEANDIILDFLHQRETFEDHLDSYFKDRSSKIRQDNDYFLSCHDADFSKRFDEVLIYLDLEVSVVELGVEEKILETMNKQYMLLNPQTNCLETLFPAAAFTFSEIKMKKSSWRESDLTNLILQGYLTRA